MRPIYLLLPAYNEEAAIASLLERTQAALAGREYRVLVVDDGSADRTAEIVRGYEARLPVALHSRNHNGGLGAAVATGLEIVRREARPGTAVVTMDADDTQDPALIPAMVQAIDDGADVVIASRFVTGSAAVGVPAHRRFLSSAARYVFGLLVGAPGIRDYTCGYRAYRLEVIEAIARRFRPLVLSHGFSVMTELLAKAHAVDARFVEVPMVLRYDRKAAASKLRLASTLLEYARVLALVKLADLRSSPAPRGSDTTRSSR